MDIGTLDATLDERDRHILALLQDDARMPLVAIARAVGLSRSATQERLRRLERTGVIARYTIRLSQGAAPPRLSAWFSIRCAPGRSCAQLVPLISPMPEVRLIHSIAGPVDLLALVEAPSMERLSAVRDAVMALPGVGSVETAVVMADHLDRR